jgi:hypothetical protein
MTDLLDDIAPFSLVEVYKRFVGAYCLHHQDGESRQYAPLKRQSTLARPHGAMSSQKAVIFMPPPWEPETFQTVWCVQNVHVSLGRE